MTFLIDENLSSRLKQLLEPVFSGCRHVSDYGLLMASDAEIHAKALLEGLALLSKDNDFQVLVAKAGPPPKLVFVRLGKCVDSRDCGGVASATFLDRVISRCSGRRRA